MNQKFSYLMLFFLFIVFTGCKKKQSFKLNQLTNQVWKYTSNSLTTTENQTNYILFDSTEILINENTVERFCLMGDTLKIYQSTNKNKGFSFIGIITKADKNEIHIKRITGYFPIKNLIGNFDAPKMIKLSSVKSPEKKALKFESISIATSDCYGTCPIFSLELNNTRKLNANFVAFCKNKGEFEGEISQLQLIKIKDILSLVELKKDSTLYKTNVDAQETVVVIQLDHKTYYLRGQSEFFHPQLQHIINLLFKLSQSSPLSSTDKSFNFKAQQYYLLPEDIMPFIEIDF